MQRTVLSSQEQARFQGKRAGLPNGHAVIRKVALPNTVKTILGRGGGVRKGISQREAPEAESRDFPLGYHR